MKHEDFYDKHVDNRKSVKKHKKKYFNENAEPEKRIERVSFKNYMRAIEEELLDTDFDE